MSARPSLRRSLPSLWKTCTRFAPHIRKQRGLLAGSAVALFAEVFLRLLEPWPLKFVLDNVVAPEGGRDPAGVPLVGSLGTEAVVAVLALAVVAVAALRATVAYASTVGLSLAGNRVIVAIRGDFYRHLQRLPLSYHSTARGGDLITRLTSDMGRLKDVTVTAALPLLVHGLTLVGMVAVMLWIDWKLALISLAIFPIAAPLLFRQGIRIRGVARRQRKREGAMASIAAEALSAIKVVQALSLEDRLGRSFSEEDRRSLKEGARGTRLAAGLERRVDVLVAVGTGLVLGVGALQVRAGALTAGELVVFMLYIRTAFKPLRDIAKYTARIAQAAASGERILEILDTEPEIRDSPGAVPAPRLRGEVAFEGLSFSYEPGRPALEGFDLWVEAGRHVALAGPSGAGKSTLVSLVPRLYQPQAGRVLIDGRDVSDYTLDSLRGQVAIVLQESVLFGISVRENIAYGAPVASDEEIEAAARLAGAHDFVEALPDGYDTVLGERGATLSGGQRQRIAIARAAVRDAPIVILDEPTTGLDRESAMLVTEALRRLISGRTTFLIAHDLRAVERADLIVYMDGGRIMEQGTHAELMERSGPYAQMYLLQEATREDEGAVPVGAVPIA